MPKSDFLSIRIVSTSNSKIDKVEVRSSSRDIEVVAVDVPELDRGFRFDYVLRLSKTRVIVEDSYATLLTRVVKNGLVDNRTISIKIIPVRD